MAIYMIDYENVKTGGLNGISRLTEADKVIIFYSENANRMTFDLHRRLMACSAEIEYREVSVGGHNALDFQLVTYLGYLIAQNPGGQYLIISNDRGFEYVVNFWRKDGLFIRLLPYLKDPAIAPQRGARPELPVKEEAPAETAVQGNDFLPAEKPAAEEASAEESRQEEAAEHADKLPAEEIITVKFCTIEEEDATLPEETVLAAEESVPLEMSAAEDIHAEEPKPPKKKSAQRKAAQKKAAPKKSAAEKSADKSAEKPARKLPAEAELRELIGELVADDPEFRFVMASLEKYKTKLGLNNALVKNFGNQRAGEIYQKVKPLV